jgi:hypothetical protein
MFLLKFAIKGMLTRGDLPMTFLNHLINFYILKKQSSLASGTTLWGRLLALPTNIRLGWRRLPGTNTLAYY